MSRRVPLGLVLVSLTGCFDALRYEAPTFVSGLEVDGAQQPIRIEMDVRCVEQGVTNLRVRYRLEQDELVPINSTSIVTGQRMEGDTIRDVPCGPAERSVRIDWRSDEDGLPESADFEVVVEPSDGPVATRAVERLAAGTLAWATPIGGLGFEAPLTVDVGDSRTVYVGGVFNGSVQTDESTRLQTEVGTAQGFVAALDGRDGSPDWLVSIATGYGSTAVQGLATAGDGTITIAGVGGGPMSGADGALIGDALDSGFIGSIRTGGGVSWMRRVRAVTSTSSGGFSNLARATDDTILATGGFYGSVVLGLNEQRATRLDGPSHRLENDAPFAYALSAIAAAYQRDGVLSWARMITTSDAVDGTDVAAAPDGGAYVCFAGAGVIRPGNGVPPEVHGETLGGFLLVHYTQTGRAAWAVRIDTDSIEGHCSLTTGPSGRAVLAAPVVGSVRVTDRVTTHVVAASNVDALIVQIDPTGVVDGLDVFGGTGEDIPLMIHAFDEGFAVVGSFRGSTSFVLNTPAGTPTTTIPHRDGGFSVDAFVARYTWGGDLVWVRTIGGAVDDVAVHLTSLPGGSLVTVGVYNLDVGDMMREPITLAAGETNETTLPGSTGQDAFIVRFAR